MAVVARFIAALVCALAAASPLQAQPAPQEDAVVLLLAHLEAALLQADRDAYAALFADSVPPQQVEDFANGLFVRNAVRSIVRERDRAPLEGAPEGDGH